MVERHSEAGKPPEANPLRRIDARQELLNVEVRRHQSALDASRRTLSRRLADTGAESPLRSFDTGVNAGKELGSIAKERAMIRAMRTAGIPPEIINEALEALDQQALANPKETK